MINWHGRIFFLSRRFVTLTSAGWSSAEGYSKEWSSSFELFVALWPVALWLLGERREVFLWHNFDGTTVSTVSFIVGQYFFSLLFNQENRWSRISEQAAKLFVMLKEMIDRFAKQRESEYFFRWKYDQKRIPTILDSMWLPYRFAVSFVRGSNRSALVEIHEFHDLTLVSCWRIHCNRIRFLNLLNITDCDHLMFNNLLFLFASNLRLKWNISFSHFLRQQ